MAFTSSNTNQEHFDERFGYQEKGTFRHAYGNELPVIISAIILFIMGYFGIGLGILAPKFGTSALLFFAIISAVLFLLEIFLFITICNIVLRGKEGTFYADSIKFTVTLSGKREVFFYDSVAAVQFSPMSLFGKPRGYNVTVITREDSYNFKYLAPKNKRYGSPEDTPFYILKRMIDKDTSPEEYKALYSDADLERPVAAMNYSKAHTAEMSSAPEPVAKPTSQHIETTASEDNFVITKGFFRVPRRSELILLFVVIPALSAGFALLSLVIAKIWLGSWELLLIMLFATVVAMTTLFRHFCDGREISYEMTRLEFRTNDDGARDVIYLSDVESVEYLSYKSLIHPKAYRVKINTKYKVIEYIYLCPRRQILSPKKTPFYDIEKIIGKASEEETPIYKRSV